MATTIYVVSTQRFSGKTALCVGLIRWLKAEGLSAGYMKPVSTTARKRGESTSDEDALFIKSIMDLPDPLDAIAPVLLSESGLDAALSTGAGEELEMKVLDALGRIGKGRDAVVMEGGTSLREGHIVRLDTPRLSRLLKTNVLVVAPFSDTVQVVDDLLAARSLVSDTLIGCVINQVPQHRIAFVEEKVRPFIEAQSIPVFAVLPREKTLMSVSVDELREGLGGEVLCCESAMGELVENLMIGAMGIETALSYFRLAMNKAVITGSDRSDIQLAALETSTRCLILTGDARPSPLVVGIAEERNVPIILTRLDTLKAVEILETFFGKTRFHQQKKIDRFEKLLDKSMDFKALKRALGLA